MKIEEMQKISEACINLMTPAIEFDTEEIVFYLNCKGTFSNNPHCLCAFGFFAS